MDTDPSEDLPASRSSATALPVARIGANPTQRSTFFVLPGVRPAFSLHTPCASPTSTSCADPGPAPPASTPESSDTGSAPLGSPIFAAVPVLENQSRQCAEADGTARIRGPDNIPFLPILEDGVAVDIAARRIHNAPKDTVVVVDTHLPQPSNRNETHSPCTNQIEPPPGSEHSTSFHAHAFGFATPLPFGTARPGRFTPFISRTVRLAPLSPPSSICRAIPPWKYDSQYNSFTWPSNSLSTELFLCCGLLQFPGCHIICTHA